MKDTPPRVSHLLILTAVRRIPRGRVATYGDIAAAAGMPRRARLVGRVLAESPLADGVPWHRVISASGRISLRDGEGPTRQRRLLESEGIVFTANRIDLARYRWKPRRSNHTPG